MYYKVSGGYMQPKSRQQEGVGAACRRLTIFDNPKIMSAARGTGGLDGDLW